VVVWMVVLTTDIFIEKGQLIIIIVPSVIFKYILCEGCFAGNLALFKTSFRV
jgi:hypothetical protein